tara:strand:+ start:736 stop:978 length:243 start_codon:yes stop_codon:yes gene_type:complete
MKINKQQLRKLIEQIDDNEFEEPPELARFTVIVYKDEFDGDFWVSFEDQTNGGSGNDPLDGFEKTLRNSAETTLRDLQRI